MPFLAESNIWETGVYEFTEADVVQGGPTGIDNVPTRQLANRTLYLKNLVDGLGTGKQAADQTLTALAALITAADKIIYATGPDAFAQTTLTAFMRTLLDDIDAATARATLGVVAASETASGLVELATNAETVAGTDTSRAAHPAGVKAAISAGIASLVNSSPTTLDTLNELAAALGNDPNFATTITALLAQKAPLASPALTGNPTAPTPSADDNDTSIATTAFVQAALLKAINIDLASPVDLNNIVKSGFYRLPGTITNSPSADANFGQMIVIHGAQDTISQVVFSYSSGNVYVRSGNPPSVGGSGSFMAWKRLSTATDLADKLPIDGSVAMTGKLQAKPGLATAGNTGNCGFVFSGDTDSGLFGGSDGMIDLVVNGLIAFRASYTHDRTFNFGPLNAWKFKMQDDGNVVVYDNLNQPKFSSLDFSSFYTRLIDTNGHQKLPGGLIMQWCTVGDGVSTSADSAISANFPVSFPNECFGVIAILVRDTALSNTWGVYAKANNLSSFTVVMDGVSPGSTAKTLFCIALGK